MALIYSQYQLDEIAQVFNGKTPAKSEQRDKGHPVLKIKNVSENKKFKGNFESFVDEDLAIKSKSKLINLDDTLILNAAHNADYVGSKQYRAESSVVNALPTGEWLIVRARHEKVDPIYLNYWFRLGDTKFKIRNLVKGIHLYPKDVAKLKIPLPPLAEQKQLAAILDAADSLRQKDQQLVEHYSALSQSLFLEMFGDPVLNHLKWHLTKVENVCTKIYGGGTPTKTIQKYFIGDIPWVTPKDMKKQYISDSLVRINHEAIQNSSAKLIPENSVLMVIRSGVLKHTLPLAISTREITINQDMKAFIPDQEQTNSAYLLYFFKSVESFLLGKVRAVTADNLEFNQIKKLSFPAPPLKLQNQFAERIAIIEKQKQQAQINLQKSEALFNSLLQRAFTGELTADKAA